MPVAYSTRRTEDRENVQEYEKGVSNRPTADVRRRVVEYSTRFDPFPPRPAPALSRPLFLLQALRRRRRRRIWSYAADDHRAVLHNKLSSLFHYNNITYIYVHTIYWRVCLHNKTPIVIIICISCVLHVRTYSLQSPERLSETAVYPSVSFD